MPGIIPPATVGSRRFPQREEMAASPTKTIKLLRFVPINGFVCSADYRREFPFKAGAGFTILEVALAAAVLGLALMSAITVMQRAFLAMDTARGLTYAAQIMQNELEKMRTTPWGDGTSGAGSGTTGVSAYPTTPDTVTIDNSFIGILHREPLHHDPHRDHCALRDDQGRPDNIVEVVR